MCVILIASEVRPTEEMVQKAWNANDDGAGIAWRENGEVHFEKGIMEVDRIKELIATVPLPFVAHFRIASVGGIDPQLTHPFLVSKTAPLTLKGKTKGAVLFHNGHWGAWNDKALDAAIHSNTEVPDGVWSDTRAMAWLTSIYGANFMELLPSQKGVLLTPKNTKVFTGNGWEKINDVWCSNDSFWKRGNYYSGGNHSNFGSRICAMGKCTNKAQVTKNICEDCEKKQQEVTTALVVSGNTAGTKTDTAGGAKNTTAPFAQAGTFLTTKEAETRYRAGDMSKSLLKRFRKEHDRLASKNPTAIKKATEKLVELTALANQRLIRGSKH